MNLYESRREIKKKKKSFLCYKYPIDFQKILDEGSINNLFQKNKKKEKEMAFLSAMKLQGRPPSISSKLNPNSKPAGSDSVSLNTSEPGSERKPRKFSSQLNRWNRARTLKSGAKLDRTIANGSNSTNGPMRPFESSNRSDVSTLDSDLSSSSNGDNETDVTAAKSIYIVSDGTGWTAEHAVNAALGQFDYCLVDRGCPVNTHLFSGVFSSFPSLISMLQF